MLLFRANLGGIPDSRVIAACRLDLNEPPTAVGGIRPLRVQPILRLLVDELLRTKLLDLSTA